MKKQLLTSSLFRLLENMIMVAIALLMTPFFINTLGNNDYGLWLLTLSILGWFNVVDLGFPSAVQRHITIALEKKDSIEINTVNMILQEYHIHLYTTFLENNSFKFGLNLIILI